MSDPFLFCYYPNDNKIQISHNPSLLKKAGIILKPRKVNRIIIILQAKDNRSYVHE